jgi:ABC-type amino acid transport substrate-binding protein
MGVGVGVMPAIRRGIVLAGLVLVACLASAQDLDQIRQAGVLRHLGIPYANFVTGAGDGLDVELVQGFAARLGLRYEPVPADWETLFPDLLGVQVKPKGDEVERGSPTTIKGDIAASGITVIPWRAKAVNFSTPVFPTQVWLIARVDCDVQPIRPTGQMTQDIAAVRALMRGRTLYCKANTCLDPSLHDVAGAGAKYRLFTGSLNDLAPAMIVNRDVEMTLLDVPDVLVALQKWPGEIKVIGPISPVQDMAVAFRPGSPKLQAAFEEYMQEQKRNGTYRRLVEKYYPYVLDYFP